jgi:hypothetical protein
LKIIPFRAYEEAEILKDLSSKPGVLSSNSILPKTPSNNRTAPCLLLLYLSWAYMGRNVMPMFIAVLLTIGKLCNQLPCLTTNVPLRICNVYVYIYIYYSIHM